MVIQEKILGLLEVCIMNSGIWLNRWGRWALALGWVIAVCLPGSAADRDNPLDTLKKEHPRLILNPQDVALLKQALENDPARREIYEKIKAEADKILDEPPVEYQLIGPRLLDKSRRCLERIYRLSLVYLMSGDSRYLQRAVKELDAAGAFPDWNPSHFLDTAEMSHAFGIAYDWLYHGLSPEERARIRTALIEKGIDAYLNGFETGAWWTKATHNWNQVCHGGVGVGALAIADEIPDKAEEVIRKAVETMPRALRGYAPDGGWDEGPGYWHYATVYTVYFLASLHSALGTDFGLSRHEGMDNAGQFRIDFEGPNGLCFNYADAGSRVGNTHEMYWLAHFYGRPVYAWFQREHSRQPHPLDFIWYSKEGDNPAKSGVPLDAFYKGIDVVFLRSAWNDRNALFVGFKGGDNKANHSHLDLGSFVLDALGHRWAVDLGGDDYNLPGYFGSQRWTYYRLINHSHNTLVIDDQIQDPKAAAPITAFHSAPDWAFAQTDLSAAYKIKKARRGLGMLGRRHILVRDEIEAEQPAEVLWGMLTPAKVALDGRDAVLTIEDKTMHARILTPENARFETVSANPPAPQRQQPDITKLVVRLPDKISTVDITVLISPDEWEKIPAAARQILPLADWNAMK